MALATLAIRRIPPIVQDFSDLTLFAVLVFPGEASLVLGSNGGITLNGTTCLDGGAEGSRTSYRMIVSSYSPGVSPFSETELLI